MFLRSRTYPEAVFARLGGIDYAPGEAAALTLPLLLLGLLLVVLERRFFGRRRFALLGPRVPREPLPLGRWRRPAGLVALTAALASVAPLAALGWRAAGWRAPGWGAPVGGGFGSLSSWLGRSPWNSVATAAGGALLASGLALVLGHALVRRRPGVGGLDALLFFAFLAPAPILGVGLITVWNRPATGWIYRTLGILVVAAVARYTIIAVRTAAVVFARSSPRLEEAASVGGAGYLRQLLGIVLPLHRRGLLGAFLLTFIFCLRDLETAVLFYPPGGEPLTVRLFTLEANGPESVVAALAWVQILIAAAATAGMALIYKVGRT